MLAMACLMNSPANGTLLRTGSHGPLGRSPTGRWLAEYGDDADCSLELKRVELIESSLHYGKGWIRTH